LCQYLTIFHIAALQILLDAYGTIEPVDLEAMTQLMNQMRTSQTVQIQGSHWASMINTIGCVKRDLEGAIQRFESLKSEGTRPLPDLLCYEALFAVIASHRRPDLLETYLARFNASGIQMNAYVANQVIKGFALGGKIERGREIFESLEDPPEGFSAKYEAESASTYREVRGHYVSLRIHSHTVTDQFVLAFYVGGHGPRGTRKWESG
jgi:hypothetical protein